MKAIDVTVRYRCEVIENVCLALNAFAGAMMASSGKKIKVVKEVNEQDWEYTLLDFGNGVKKLGVF